MDKKNGQEPIIKRIGGYLHKLTPIVDSTGKIVSHTMTHFMVEFRL